MNKKLMQCISTAAAGVILAAAFGIGTAGSVSAQQDAKNNPGPNLTAQFEIEYLKFTIDHHFAALRITELAAGTDATRNPHISANEGTSSTPGFPATPAKATIDDIKSLARRNNRMQREEILTAQKFLHDWYGINYQPQISDVNMARIQILTEAPAGNQFNHLFLEVLSRHHFTIAARSTEAIVSSAMNHEPLRRYARGILDGQLNDISEMRDLLCQNFNVCDFQPYVGIKGVHTGDDGEIDNRYSVFRRITRDEDEDQENHTENR